MKLSMHEELMVHYKSCCFPARSAHWRIQGGAKIGHEGSPSSDQKATATNRIHSNDLEACEKKCCYFLVPFRSQIFDAFWRLFGLSHFALF